jgi:hypothetical protein
MLVNGRNPLKMGMVGPPHYEVPPFGFSATSVVSGSSGFSTTFPNIENPLNQGGAWLNGALDGTAWNNVQVFGSERCVGTNQVSNTPPQRYMDSNAQLKTSVFTANADQWAQGTVYRNGTYTPVGDKHEIELYLRMSISANSITGYEIMWGMDSTIGFYLDIVRWNGTLGDFTTIIDGGDGSIPAPNDGDVLRAEIVGNLITVKLNGSIITSPVNFSAIDITSVGTPVYSSGQPGLGFWPTLSATPENYGWKAWSCGNM